MAYEYAKQKLNGAVRCDDMEIAVQELVQINPENDLPEDLIDLFEQLMDSKDQDLMHDLQEAIHHY